MKDEESRLSAILRRKTKAEISKEQAKLSEAEIKEIEK